MLKAPTAPADAPAYAIAILRDFIVWVRALLKQPAHLPWYEVGNLPDPAAWHSAARDGYSALIFVGNEAGGAVPAFSDGLHWRRVTDRSIVS